MRYPSVFLLLWCFTILSCTTTPDNPQQIEVSIAFMPDIHFHDIYGEFPDQSFHGLPTETPQGNRRASIRSMRAQLNSTRLFNENYFALLAALDDVVTRKIKYVALPGDFSDDGQPLHIRGLQKVLDFYHHNYGLEFFLAPGNHDPVRPFSRPAGKPDYLGKAGKEQPVFSHNHPACLNINIKPDAHPVICTDEVMEWGYEPIMEALGNHGFYPKDNYRYFETPYSTYAYEDYDYQNALDQADFHQRQYEICQQGTGGAYKQPGFTQCYNSPDASYLVEPVQGVWLLAIDANIYQPDASNPDSTTITTSGSGNAGYNKVVTHKTHLLEWITDVVQRAEQHQKTLIAFSHFPTSDFYDGAAGDIAQLLGDKQFQLPRQPTSRTSKALAETGLKIHVAGHMHINDTGIYRDQNHVLFNIQAPSLAAYVPAYKVLTLKPHHQIEINTIILDEVPRFNELFDHYLAEWNHLNESGAPDIWNRHILNAPNYYAFTQWHLRELVRLRFLPQEWPEHIRTLLLTLNGEDLLILSQLNIDISMTDIKLAQQGMMDQHLQHAWDAAKRKAEHLAQQHEWTSESFSLWNGQDVGLDIYRLRNADQLAFNDIPLQRLQQYHLLAQQLAQPGVATETTANGTSWQFYREKFARLFTILRQFSATNPSDHFLLDLQHDVIRDLRDSNKQE